MAIFFLCPSKQFLTISFQIQLLDPPKAEGTKTEAAWVLIRWIRYHANLEALMGAMLNSPCSRCPAADCAVSERICPIAACLCSACASPGRVCSTAARAVPGRVSSQQSGLQQLLNRISKRILQKSTRPEAAQAILGYRQTRPKASKAAVGQPRLKAAQAAVG
jgi:hypothetical protein